MDTLIYAANECVAKLDQAIFPPVGTVVQLGKPNRDAVVLDVRLEIREPRGDGGYSGWNVRIEVDEPGDLIPRVPRASDFEG